MSLVYLCSSSVTFIIFFSLAFFSTRVLSVEIKCVPLDNCTFALNVLTKRNTPEVLNFLKSSKCGREEGTNKLKIWCSKFTNCKTPDNRYGTCIPAKSCAVFADLLTNDRQDDIKASLSKYLCSSPQISETLVCCPSSTGSTRNRFESSNEIYNELSTWNQERSSQRKRQADQYPWLSHNHGNNFFGADLNNQLGQRFLNQHAGHLKNDNFEWPNFNFGEKKLFTDPNNNFYDHLRSGQSEFQNKLQHSLQEQNKWLQNSLKNTSKTIFNQNNQFLNWWNWYPEKSNHNVYNFTEETSDSMIENCLSPANVEGICKPYRECPTFLTAMNQVNIKDNAQKEYLKKFRCKSSTNEIRVCCSENEIILPNNASDRVRTNGELEGDNNPLASISNICGRQVIDDKIIGGTTTDLAEFPWTALFQYQTSKGLTFGCGGSIISNRYIVTAAHCVNKNILRQAGFQNLQNIVLGEYDRRNETDCIYTRYGSNCADPPQYFRIERIIEHEEFRSNATPNDIALVRVNRNINFTNYIRPICLPAVGSLNLNYNESFTITGWGRTESGESSPVKRKARLPVVSKDNCGQLGPLASGQMCLGSGNGTDSCKGDSGGPVMRPAIKSDDIVMELVGIISFGFGKCGTTTSVSTNIPHYMEWILKNIS